MHISYIILIQNTCINVLSEHRSGKLVTTEIPLLDEREKKDLKEFETTSLNGKSFLKTT